VSEHVTKTWHFTWPRNAPASTTKTSYILGSFGLHPVSLSKNQSPLNLPPPFQQLFFHVNLDQPLYENETRPPPPMIEINQSSAAAASSHSHIAAPYKFPVVHIPTLINTQSFYCSSGICWAICKSAPHPRQSHQHPTTQFFIVWMPFLPPNQQRQSTKGTSCCTWTYINPLT